jgi:hypothetical protein
MAEIPPSPNRPISSERPLPPYRPLLGLQGRLAIGGEALKPNASVELKKGFENVEPTLNLLTTASKGERAAHWALQPEQTKDTQLAAWKKSVTTKISSLSETKLGQEHADFFVKMGIDVAHFTEASAQTLYDTYFSKDREGTSLELFMHKVVEAYSDQSTTDIDALKSHLTAVQWMAGIFGRNSSELVTQLLDAQIDSASNPAKFVTDRKEKVNALSAHEKELLTFLTKAETAPITPPKRKSDEAFTIKSEPIITITKEEIDKLFDLNKKPELITIGKDSENNDITVHMGFPDKKDQNGYTIFPSEPYVFVADNLALSDKNHNEALKKVTVIAAHGIRAADNTWRFLNQQDVYQTVLKYNEYAKKNGLPPIEFIMSCSAPNQPNKLNIISIDTGNGTIVQSDNASINVSLYKDAATGENNATASFGNGEFIGIDELIKRKKETIINPPAAEQFMHDYILQYVAGKATIAEVDMDALAQEYKRDPLAMIQKMQEKTLEKTLRMKHDANPEEEIKDTIRGFLKAQLDLDNRAFLPDDTVKQGVPAYLPDGFSDMGSDSEPDEAKRTHKREKIRIDKEQMFENSIDILYSLFTTDLGPRVSSKARKTWMTDTISGYVHNKIKYDYQHKLDRMHRGTRSINASESSFLELGVCRHHAIDTQVLLQSLGINSRLLKSNFRSADAPPSKALEAHANNLVEIEGEWFLLDTTNTEFKGDGTDTQIVFRKPIPPVQDGILKNPNAYTWEPEKTQKDGTKKKRKYVSRNDDMYYRVRNNKANPATLHYLSP